VGHRRRQARDDPSPIQPVAARRRCISLAAERRTQGGGGEAFGVVESVKAASDLYSPVAGRISAVNDKLATKPELINSDPYGDGWILKLELAGDLPGDLLDEAEYKKVTEAAEH
jgi:glycine cleavage system H lipoate-binding protein